MERGHDVILRVFNALVPSWSVNVVFRSGHSFFEFVVWLLVQILEAETLGLGHVILVVLYGQVFRKLDGVRVLMKVLAMLIDSGHQLLLLLLGLHLELLGPLEDLVLLNQGAADAAILSEEGPL